MPNFLSLVLIECYVLLSRFSILLNKSTRIILCPAPVPEGNRGDQALMIGAVEELERRGVDRITLVATSQHPIETYQLSDKFKIITHLHYIFQTDQCFLERLKWIKLLINAKELIVLGADVLDEGYSAARSDATFWAVRTAAKLGVNTRVVGFSVNGPPSDGLKKRMSALGSTRLFVRDPVSYLRLKHAEINNIELSGDIAFLMEPVSPDLISEDVRHYCNEHPNRIIGLNVTPVVFDEEHEDLLEALSRAVVILAEEHGYRFLLIPHDDQGGIEFLHEFSKRLNKLKPGIHHLISSLPSARQLKAIAGKCLHLFTCRLHLGIATLGMGRPITCFPYQGKFEGQFQHFGLAEDGLLDLETLPTNPKDLAAIMHDRIQQSDKLAEQIQSRLPEVQRLARSNFDGI